MFSPQVTPGLPRPDGLPTPVKTAPQPAPGIIELLPDLAPTALAAPIHELEGGGVVGIFVRADHPSGWGAPKHEHENGHRAHGYVVVMVSCISEDQLDQVAKMILRHPFHGKPGARYSEGHLGEWFGGRFYLVGRAPEVRLNGEHPYQPVGDQCMIAFYDAETVLAIQAETYGASGEAPQPPNAA